MPACDWSRWWEVAGGIGRMPTDLKICSERKVEILSHILWSKFWSDRSEQIKVIWEVQFVPNKRLKFSVIFYEILIRSIGTNFKGYLRSLICSERKIKILSHILWIIFWSDVLHSQFQDVQFVFKLKVNILLHVLQLSGTVFAKSTKSLKNFWRL